MWALAGGAGRPGRRRGLSAARHAGKCGWATEWAAREAWAAHVGKTGPGELLGLRGELEQAREGGAGPRSRKEGEERAGQFWTWAGLLPWFGFPFLFLFSYFKHYSNLIEFKFKFEFNTSTQTNKRDAPV